MENDNPDPDISDTLSIIISDDIRSPHFIGIIDNNYSNSNSNSNELLNQSRNFYNIIDNFCTSLIDFAKSIKQPTSDISDIIHKKTNRNKSFDNYVSSVEKFNTIMQNVIYLLKKVIISLNHVFVYGTIEEVAIFMENLNVFLRYLLTENIFAKLTILKLEIGGKHKSDIDILQKIKNIKDVMIHVVNMSINITSLLIPQLGVISQLITVIDENLNESIDKKIEKVAHINDQLDGVIRSLLNVQTRADILESFEGSNVLQFLSDRVNNEKILKIGENLYTEYISLLHVTLSLHSTIEIYKRRKKNVLLTLVEYMKM